MDFLLDLERDPDFQTLNYTHQVHVRMDAALKHLQNDPDFNTLPQVAKRAVIDSVAYRPPALQDKQLQAHVTNLGNVAVAGDRNARNLVMDALTHRAFKRSTLMYRVLDDAFVAPVKKAIVEAGFADVRFMEKESKERQLEQLQLLSKFDPDTEKAAQYLSYLTNRDKRWAKSAQFWTSVSQTAGALVDIIATEAILAGTITAPKLIAKGVFKTIDKIAARSTKFIGLRALDLTKSLSHAAITGAIGVARENTLATLNRMQLDPHGAEVMLNNKDIFFQYFFWDAAVNLFYGVGLPMLKVMKGNLKGWGQHQEFFKGISGADLKEVQYAAVTGRILDPQLMRRMPEEVQDILKQMQIYAALNKNVIPWTDDNVLSALAQSHGFVALKEGDIYKLGRIGEKGRITKNTYKEATQWLKNQQGKLKFLEISDVEASVQSAMKGRTSVRTILRGTLKESSEKNIDVLTNLASPKAGIYTKADLNAFVRTLLKAEGAEAGVLRGVRVLEEADKFKLRIPGFSDDLEIPKGAVTSRIEAATLKKITNRVSAVTEGKVSRELQEGYIESLAKQEIYTPAWAEWAVTNKMDATLRKVNQFQTDVVMPDGVVHSFSDPQDLGRFVMLNSLDEADVVSQLQRRSGIKVQRNRKTGLYTIIKGKQRFWQGSFEDLLKHPDLDVKIPSYLGPELTLLDNNRLRIEYVKSIAVGKHQHLLRHLDKFASYNSKKKLSLVRGRKGNLSHGQMRKWVEVEIPRISWRQKFTSINEAKQFLDGGWDNYITLKRAAAEKGLRLDTLNGEYIVHDAAGMSRTFKTKDGLLNALQDVPKPEWLPELSGVSDDILAMAQPPPPDFGIPFEYKMPNPEKGYSILTMLSHSWRPPDAWFIKAIEQGADPGYLKHFREIEDTLQAVRAMENEVSRIINTIAKRGRTGKYFSRESAEKIGEYMQSKNKPATRTLLNLTDDEIRAADELRDLFGKTDEQGLFFAFDIDPDMFVENYLPHIKKWALDHPNQQFADSNLKGFFRAIWGPHPPKELDAWFRKMRVSDVMDMAFEKNPFVLAQKYNFVGHRQRFLGPVWKRIDKWLDSLPDDIAKDRFNIYRNQVMGLPQTWTEELARKITGTMLERMGMKGAVRIKDLTKALTSVGYMSALGIRPYMWFRNSFQIFTTLAPKVGNRWVVQALNDIVNDSSGAIFDGLRAQGIITRQLPVFGAEALDPIGPVSRLATKAMKWYKNSDEFTRAVAYRATMLRYTDAVDRYRKGILKTRDELFDMAGLWNLPTDMKNRALSYMTNNEWSVAGNMYATEIVNQTMFPYRAGMSPTAFRGVVGNLFGQFGTYPVHYLENIKRTLKHASTGQKIAFATTWIGNMTFIAETFRQVGINPSSFIFWRPATFAGGPWFHMGYQMTQLMAPNYRGRQARAELLGLRKTQDGYHLDLLKSQLALWLVPFSFYAKSFGSAIQNFNKGDSWAAFLDLSSAPRNMNVQTQIAGSSWFFPTAPFVRPEAYIPPLR